MSSDVEASMPARDRLVAATKSLLWQQGIEATSPADILKNSGVGQGSLYHHFSGKPAVVAEATASLAADLQAETDVVLADETRPPIDRVRSYLTKQRDARAGCRLGRLVFDPGLDAAAAVPIAGYFTGLQDSLAELLSRARSEGDWDTTLSAEEVAAAIAAAIQGGYVLAAATADPGAMDRALRGVAGLIAPGTNAAPRRQRRTTTP